METKEKTNNEEKFRGWPNMSCCGAQGSQEATPDCCKSVGGDDNSRSMMNKCMKGCRWFLLLPIVLGIALLMLGYFLNPEITRMLWMIAAGFVILVVIFVLLIMSRMKQMCC